MQPQVSSFTDVDSLSQALSANKHRLPFVACPDDVYRATGCLSFHDAQVVDESPAKFKLALTQKRKETASLAIGKAIHCALLEPTLLEQKFAVVPNINRRTKVGKAEYAAWVEANGAKTILRESEMDTVRRVMEKIRGESFFGQFLEPGLKEVSFFAPCDFTDLHLRGRLDNFIPELNVIIDLKTTDCARRAVFNHDIEKYGYAMQAAWYMDLVLMATGKRPDAYLIVAVEKGRDCDGNVFEIPEKAMALASNRCLEWRQEIAACSKLDRWPGYKRKLNQFEPSKRWLKHLGGAWE